ncbi:hypothetical protein K402DRAFT_404961 [Aulographum hederae CBS 113979]|uniref:Uncharacterized protein n=1 Tax=Aulographum hederae CBS 113979 TaxID=1176131 RepID=A0A6G1GY06_9PEZI|nr:hypothetical protein K402DRAFT_404961 [Aulographum hederae CBS 113979]
MADEPRGKVLGKSITGATGMDTEPDRRVENEVFLGQLQRPGPGEGTQADAGGVTGGIRSSPGGTTWHCTKSNGSEQPSEQTFGAQDVRLSNENAREPEGARSNKEETPSSIAHAVPPGLKKPETLGDPPSRPLPERPRRRRRCRGAPYTAPFMFGRWLSEAPDQEYWHKLRLPKPG